MRPAINSGGLPKQVLQCGAGCNAPPDQPAGRSQTNYESVTGDLQVLAIALQFFFDGLADEAGTGIGADATVNGGDQVVRKLNLRRPDFHR